MENEVLFQMLGKAHTNQKEIDILVNMLAANRVNEETPDTQQQQQQQRNIEDEVIMQNLPADFGNFDDEPDFDLTLLELDVTQQNQTLAPSQQNRMIPTPQRPSLPHQVRVLFKTFVFPLF